MGDTTARGRLMLRPSPDMDTTAVDTDMAATDTDVSMVDTADTTERGPLMLRPSPDMLLRPWLWIWWLRIRTCLWWIRQILRINLNPVESIFIPSQQHSF